jgi:hypothetical protein
LTVALFHFVRRWAVVMAQVTARVGLKINRTVPLHCPTATSV